MLFCAYFTLMTAIALAAEMSAEPSNQLDGLQFVGETGEQGKGNHHPDTIMFQGGMFRSLDCENYGFGPAPYTVVRNGDVQFEHLDVVAQLAGGPPGQAERSARAGEHDVGTLLPGESRHAERQRGVGEDTGDHDLLAVEQTHHPDRR